MELLQQLVNLNKPIVNQAIAETRILRSLLELTQQFEWNDCLHQKSYLIFESFLENQPSTEAKAAVMADSQVCSILAQMASQDVYTHASSRQVRNGWMGFVVRLANLIKKRGELD